MWLFCVCGAELWLKKDYFFPILFNHDMILFLHMVSLLSRFQTSQNPTLACSVLVIQYYLASQTSFSLVTELNQIYKQRIKTRHELVKSNTPVLHKSHFYVSRVQTLHIYSLTIFQSLGHPSKLSLELLSPLFCLISSFRGLLNLFCQPRF